MYTAEQVDKAIDWRSGFHWHTGVAQSSTLDVPVTLVKPGNDCDHDTCYDTHDQEWIVGVGDQRFLKKATYSSSDGTVWEDGLVEVEAVEVVRTEWTEVKRVPLTAKSVEKAIEASFGNGDHGLRYLEPASSRNPEPTWVDVDLSSWKDFAEFMEYGSLIIPKVGPWPLKYFVKPEEFEDLDSTELECVFTYGDQMFVKQGTWVSHDGAYWDGDVFEAKIAQKTVNHWVTVE